MERTAHPLQPAVERIIKAARRLTRTADEFWPEHPEAIGEDLEALAGAMEHYGHEVDRIPAAQIEALEGTPF